jgi:hypothetical protein
MRDYEVSYWFTLGGAFAMAHIRARQTGERQRIECDPQRRFGGRFVVVPAKPPVVSA